MANGIVKWFYYKKGFGFIQPEDGSKDVFVHITALQKAGIDELKDGTRISYDIVSAKGRTSADNLRIL